MRSAMKRLTLAPVILLPALVWAAGPASAKGAVSVTISGPGIDEPVEVLDAFRIHDTGMWTALGDVDPAFAAAPTKDLGPRHTLTWRVISGQDEAGQYETTPIRQDLYLDAADGPVVHTPPGQPFRDSVTAEVWFPVRDGLRGDLVAAGAPLTGGKPTAGNPTAGKLTAGKLTADKPNAGTLTAGKPPAGDLAPAPSGDPVWPELMAAGAGGLALAGAGTLAIRRARRLAALSA